MTDQIDIRHLLIFLTDKRRDERAWRRQALASRAEGSDDRSNQRAAKEGKTWSGVSEPSSQQRVSVKAVKGGGKEKEDFLPAQALTVLPLKEFKACDGKKYSFPVGCKAKPKPMPELCITLDGRSL